MAGLQTRVDSNDSATLLIVVDGRLDYNLRKEFRESFNETSSSTKNFKVNLLNTSFIDSSGLGLLLILKEHADEKGGKVVLSNPNEEVLELLELSNFTQLFTIEK